MRHEFVNERPVVIDPGPPNTIRSELVVTNLGQATVENLEVHVNITHTWTGDLRLKLSSPDGTQVVLVDRRGGSRNDFRNTIFRADAQTSITAGRHSAGPSVRRDISWHCGEKPRQAAGSSRSRTPPSRMAEPSIAGL